MYTAAFVKKKKEDEKKQPCGINPNYNGIKSAVYLVSSLP